MQPDPELQSSELLDQLFVLGRIYNFLPCDWLIVCPKQTAYVSEKLRDAQAKNAR